MSCHTCLYTPRNRNVQGPMGPTWGYRENRQKWVFVRYESRNGNFANQYSSRQDRLFVP